MAKKFLFRIKEIYEPGEWFEQWMTEKAASFFKKTGKYSVEKLNG